MSLASEIKNSKRYFKHLRALPAQISTRHLEYFTIYCDRIRLIINTTTRDAQKIASLAQFCERHILGGFDDE